MTTKEATELTGFSSTSIAKFCALGIIPAVKKDPIMPGGKPSWSITIGPLELKQLLAERSPRPRKPKGPVTETSTLETLFPKDQDFFALSDITDALRRPSTTIYGHIHRLRIKAQKFRGTTVVTRKEALMLAQSLVTSFSRNGSHSSATEPKSNSGDIARLEAKIEGLATLINELVLLWKG